MKSQYTVQGAEVRRRPFRLVVAADFATPVSGAGETVDDV